MKKQMYNKLASLLAISTIIFSSKVSAYTSWDDLVKETDTKLKKIHLDDDKKEIKKLKREIESLTDEIDNLKKNLDDEE